MSDHTFTAEQAAKIVTAMRREAGLEPERFPLSAFVGMISDEIDLLRSKGATEESILSILRSNGAEVSAEELHRYYATPEQRGHGPEGQ